MKVARQLMEVFFTAPNTAVRHAAAERICKAAPNLQAIERCLRAGRSYPNDAATGWQFLRIPCLDGQKRSYQLYAPEDYASARKYPLLVYLHGGVTRDEVPSLAETKGTRQFFETLAKNRKCLVLLPGGQGSAAWWDSIGSENVLAQLDFVKCHYNIDEDRIFLWGMSDGGGGACWMALHRPTVWTGFLAYSPNLGVTNLGPYPCYPRNLLNRPLLAANGGRDGMGPGFNSRFARHWFDQLCQLGAPVNWKDFPDAGHGASMGPDGQRRTKFLNATVRNPRPARVVWETADLTVGRCDWVRIDKIKDVGDNDAELVDVNLTPDQPLDIGLEFDANYSGRGLLIRRVLRRGPAAKAGLRAGDVLVSVEGVAMAKDAVHVFRGRVWSKKPGDKITGEYQRDGRTQPFTAKTSEEAGQPLFPRPQLAGAVDARVEGNRVTIRARNVAQYTLFINRDQFDLDRPIQVLTNGRESFHAKVTPDLAFMLFQAAEDNDRQTVYCAKIEIVLSSRGTKKDKD